MALSPKSHSISFLGALALSYGLLPVAVTTQSILAAPAQAAFPVRKDVTSSSQFGDYERTDRARIQPYLRSLNWLYDAGWIQARQNELFLYFFAKLKHETATPFVGEKNLLDWRATRHDKAYSTQLVKGQLQISNEKAAWETIVEDLKVGARVLNSNAPEARRKEAFALSRLICRSSAPFWAMLTPRV